jgi:hypothetical protein
LSRKLCFHSFYFSFIFLAFFILLLTSGFWRAKIQFVKAKTERVAVPFVFREWGVCCELLYDALWRPLPSRWRNKSTVFPAIKG